MTETSPPIDIIKPTKETYDRLQYLYDYLNRHLFDSELPGCLLTLQRRKRTYGFFSRNRFTRQDGERTDEIALNPAHFKGRSNEEILATLAHEMVHQWQHHYGKSGRGSYHNRQWAEKMKSIGLQPTDTGEEGGKETGERVFHFITPGGLFEKTATRLSSKGLAVHWVELPQPAKTSRKSPDSDSDEGITRSGERLKYVCTFPECGQSLRGCSGQLPLCQGNHQKGTHHEPALMEPEPSSPA